MLKRVLVSSAVLLLVIAFSLPAVVFAETETYYTSLATVQGDVYAVQNGKIAIYDPTLGEFRSTDKAVSSDMMLVDSTDGFYLFSLSQKTLIQLDTEAPYAEIRRLRLSQFPSDNDVEVYRAVAMDNALYLLISDFSSDSFRGVWAYNLNTDQQITCPVPSVVDIICAGDGSLVLYSAPLGKEGMLYTWNINDRATRHQSVPGNTDVMPGGLAYFPANQSVYMQTGSTILLSRDDTLEEIAYSSGYAEADLKSAAFTPDEYYMTFYSDGTLRKISLSEQHQQVLRIAGRFSDSALLDAYREASPDVAVIYTQDNPYDEKSFAEAVINRSLNADMIITSTSSSLYQTLIRKGYVLPLDECSQLKDYINCMYPHMIDQVALNGQYFGLPVAISAETMGYQADLFAELDLTIPTSVEELLQFCMNASLPQDIGMLNSSLYTLSDILLQQIIDISLAQGLEADIATVKRLLEMWEQLEISDELYGSDLNEQTLFTPVCDILPGSTRMGQEKISPLLLSAVADQQAVIPASMEVMMIYAGTTQVEQCLDFMTYCSQNLNTATQIALFPERNDPVLKTGLVEQIAALENELSYLSDQLSQQSDNEMLLLQQEEVMLSLQKLQDDPWQISAQDIVAYREAAPYFVFNQRQWRYDTNNIQIYQLRERLRERQINADTFLKKYQDLLWMMQQESGLN